MHGTILNFRTDLSPRSADELSDGRHDLGLPGAAPLGSQLACRPLGAKAGPQIYRPRILEPWIADHG
jgi:hypothetical protein